MSCVVSVRKQSAATDRPEANAAIKVINCSDAAAAVTCQSVCCKVGKAHRLDVLAACQSSSSLIYFLPEENNMSVCQV